MKKLILLIVFLSQIIGMAVAQDTALFARNSIYLGSKFKRIDTISKIIFSSEYDDNLKLYDSHLENAIKTGKDSTSKQISHVIKYCGIMHKKIFDITLIYAKKIDDAYFISMDKDIYYDNNWHYNKYVIWYYVVLILVFILFLYFIKSQSEKKRSRLNFGILSVIILTIIDISNYDISDMITIIFLSIIIGYIVGTFLLRAISNYLYQIDKEERAKSLSLLLRYISILISLRVWLFFKYNYCIVPSIIMLFIIIIYLLHLHKNMKIYKRSNASKNRKQPVMEWKEYREYWNNKYLYHDD